MDIAVQNVFGVVQNGFSVVGEDDLAFCASFFDEAAVEFQIVNAGEWVENFAEQFAVLSFGQYVGPWVNAFFVQQFFVDQMVAISSMEA